VARQLREAIVSGRLAVGTELPSEKDLGAQLGVSRSTVREALRVLQAQGLLSGGDTVSTTRPRVSGDLTTASASQALENAVRMQRVRLDDLVELRLLLEGAAVRSARPGSALADARAALELMQVPGIDVATLHAADVRFHECLARAGGNEVIPLVMAVLRDAIAGHLRRALEALPDPAPVIEALVGEHLAILDAVERGAGDEAAEAVRAHIWDFYSRTDTEETEGR